MKITVVYGTQRRSPSNTYNIAQLFIEALAGPDPVTSFFLPESFPHFCRNCYQCFLDHTKCPNYASLKPLLEAFLEADLLIFTAPAYVFNVPGQVKALLDHFGYAWMAHQPRREMFKKQALLISTAAGAGTRPTLQCLKNSMNFWGVARCYPFGRNVHAIDWREVNPVRKEKIIGDIHRLAEKIKRESRSVTPSWRVKGLFYAMRWMHKTVAINPVDVAHWQQQGWLGKARPWKE